MRQKSVIAIKNICLNDPHQSIPVALPSLIKALKINDDDAQRLGACTLMNALVEGLGVSMIPYVHCLLPISMSMMTDPVERCSKLASTSFAYLVRLAPLVGTEEDDNNNFKAENAIEDEAQVSESFRKVVDHLIHGKPLPLFPLPIELESSLAKSSIKLRKYQKEGISWLCLLQTLRLNGLLGDDMGLVCFHLYRCIAKFEINSLLIHFISHITG